MALISKHAFDSKGNVTFAGMSIVSQADGNVVLE